MPRKADLILVSFIVRAIKCIVYLMLFFVSCFLQLSVEFLYSNTVVYKTTSCDKRSGAKRIGYVAVSFFSVTFLFLLDEVTQRFKHQRKSYNFGEL